MIRHFSRLNRPASRSTAFRLRGTLAAAAVIVLPGLARAADRVAITEIHYNPPPGGAGERLEFVEIHNPGSEELRIDGWRFVRGIAFTFPAGARLAAGGRAVVCTDLEALRRAYPGLGGDAYGDYTGSLDNAGENLVLVDAFDALVTSARYDDDPPWPAFADGQGHSLQRRCATDAASEPGNWTSALPTPAGLWGEEACPPPLRQTPPVVISELFYNPPGELRGRTAGRDPEDLEYVEVHNLTDASLDISGWSLSDGILFDFPPGTVLEARGYLAVGKSVDDLRARFEVENAIGDYEGHLSNRGERVSLSDAEGRIVDSVAFEDDREWPYGPDGCGPSLERIVAEESGESPANWAASIVERDRYRKHEIVGRPGPYVLSSTGTARFIISLDGEGEMLVDDVVLEDVANPGRNLLTNPGFDSSRLGWSTLGNALQSEWREGEGPDGSGALLLRSTGPCPRSGCGAFNGVGQILEGVRANRSYRISLQVRSLSGSFAFRAGFLEGSAVHAVWGTPGRENSVAGRSRPPHISHPGRFPAEPGSADPVWITARVNTPPGETPEVRLLYEVDRPGVEPPEPLQGEVEMLDDGNRVDGTEGDSVFGAELPGFPGGSRVSFRVVARSGAREVVFPQPLFRDSGYLREQRGYYVHDQPPGSSLPVYHLFIRDSRGEEIDGNDWAAVNRALNCDELRSGGFAFAGEFYPDVGLRFRGNTACFINKRNFKVRFNKGHSFRGLAVGDGLSPPEGRIDGEDGIGNRGIERMNLNGIWTDKALVREHVAWDFVKQLGGAYCQTQYVRVHVNSVYYGLFLYVEHPGDRFLDRNGLSRDGMLYKSLQPPDDGSELAGVKNLAPGTYHLGWEEETHRGGDFSDLEEFIIGMHEDGSVRNLGPNIEFWRERSFEESIIDFQVGQVVLNNIDSSVKNHFLYRDPVENRWALIPWDLDLVFGKFFTFEAVDFAAGRQVGTLNDLMLSDLNLDLNPWTMTSVRRNMRYNWLLDYFFRAGVDDDYQRAYIVRLWNVLQEKYRNEIYDPELDRLLAVLGREADLDFALWGRYPSNVRNYPADMAANIEIMKQQLRKHRDFLIRYLEQFHAEIIAQTPRIQITELMYLPEAGEDDLEYIELVNFSDGEVDLTGWTIDAIAFRFPEASRLAPGDIAIVARSPLAFRSRYPDRAALLVGPYPGKLDNSGEEIVLRDGGPGYPATIDRVDYRARGEWPTVEPGFSIELREASTTVDNDRGENWRRSVAGGDPGSKFPVFVRGEVQGDDLVDVSDAIFLLVFSFLGGKEPDCLDAGDIDDSGIIDISDPIYLIAHLFLGGRPPPAPFPDPGGDPTDDELGCAASLVP